MTQAKKTTKENGLDLEKELAKLQAEHKEMGTLAVRIKGVKTKEGKADVRKKYLFELNAIKKKIAVFKKHLEESPSDKILKKLLTWERQRNLIGVADEYKLNAMEESNPDLKECECYNTAPSGFFAELGGRYKYYSVYDEARTMDVYYTYIKRIIEPEEQIDKELAWKMQNGFMPERKDYAPPKEQMRRIVLSETQWNRFFREV